MSNKKLSEQQLRSKLEGEFSEEQIDSLIDQYVAAAAEELPNMEAIASLAQKEQEDKLLRVFFKLSTEQYDALSAYFGEPQRSATFLVQKALEEFIQLI